jgi:predicted RNA binding protein YcfA (HicA-like mRNA interferase family)
MPTLGPIKRRELIRYLRQLGFSGPYAGGNHEFMKRGNLKLPIPNPH